MSEALDDPPVIQYARIGQNMEAEAQVELVFAGSDHKTRFVALKTLPPLAALLATSGTNLAGEQCARNRIPEWRENSGKALAAAKAVGQILDSYKAADPLNQNSRLCELLTEAKLELEEPISYFRTRRGSISANEDSMNRRNPSPTSRMSSATPIRENGGSPHHSGRKIKRRTSVPFTGGDVSDSFDYQSSGSHTSRSSSQRTAVDTWKNNNTEDQETPFGTSHSHSDFDDNDGSLSKRSKRPLSLSPLKKSGDQNPSSNAEEHPQRKQKLTKTRSAPPLEGYLYPRVAEHPDDGSTKMSGHSSSSPYLSESKQRSEAVNAGKWTGPRIRFGTGKKKSKAFQGSPSLAYAGVPTDNTATPITGDADSANELRITGTGPTSTFTISHPSTHIPAKSANHNPVPREDVHAKGISAAAQGAPLAQSQHYRSYLETPTQHANRKLEDSSLGKVLSSQSPKRLSVATDKTNKCRGAESAGSQLFDDVDSNMIRFIEDGQLIAQHKEMKQLLASCINKALAGPRTPEATPNHILQSGAADRNASAAGQRNFGNIPLLGKGASLANGKFHGSNADIQRSRALEVTGIASKSEAATTLPASMAPAYPTRVLGRLDLDLFLRDEEVELVRRVRRFILAARHSWAARAIDMEGLAPWIGQGDIN